MTLPRSLSALPRRVLSSPSTTTARLQRPLLPRRAFTTTPNPHADFTHAIIGGGVIGFAIARQLQLRSPPGSVLLIERHAAFGAETSSRNSEVVHAGLYYGHGSLKTRLCVAGKQALYDLCEERGIPHRRCGKWIVAQDDAQMAQLQGTHEFAGSIGVPTRFLSAGEAERREPEVRARAGVLESETTGIVDSHALMAVLEHEFVERLGGDVAYGCRVMGVEGIETGKRGWRVRTRSGRKGDPAGVGMSQAALEGEEMDDEITVETVINSAGLGAVDVHNMVAAEGHKLTPFYAKGSYYSYSASHPKPSVLVYPAPMPGHGGLGTHLTLDMAGRVRFGPDLQWVDDPHDLSVNDAGFETALADIETYLPGLQREKVGLDYCGIRPKLSRKSSATAGENFVDFVIERGEDKLGVNGWVDLLGMESPGLTSSLAIAKYVEDLLYR